jgi:hypothetical protein
VSDGASTLRNAAKRGETRAQPAVEQDQRQRDRAHDIGHPHVVEFDAARSLLARQHADDQEDQQQRRPEPQGDQAGQDAGQHQERADQDAETDGVERSHACPLRILRLLDGERLRSATGNQTC